MWELLPYYLLLGLGAGMLAGLLGVGGGLVIVPALLWLFAWQDFPSNHLMQLALGTSLATIVVTSVASARAHHARGAVRWDLLRRMTPGILIGAGLGAWLADHSSSANLQRGFAVFELLVAAQLIVGLRAQRQRRRGGHAALPLAGVIIGTLSALLGIGGGTLSVPWLRWRGVDMRQAVGTAAGIGFPIALAGVVGYAWVGLDARVPPASSGFVHWPAVAAIGLTSVLSAGWGAAWAHRLPRHRLQQGFALVLVVVGLRMLW